jgi:BASS family bile acid:Na+ symporter
MVIVGLGLTAEDFRRVARQPQLISAATLGQVLITPLIGHLLVRSLDLAPHLANGILLVVACPAGSMANLYAHLARANVALSVTLTAVSCLAGVLTLPVIMAVNQTYLGDPATFAVPASDVVGQLVLTLILPILTGMAIRRAYPSVADRYRHCLLGLSWGALILLLGFVVANAGESFAAALGETVVVVVALTSLSWVAGWVTGWAAGAAPADRFTVGMVFVVRNVGIATVIAVTVLGRVDFAVFATAYFVCQMPLALAAVAAFRHVRLTEVGVIAGGNHP